MVGFSTPSRFVALLLAVGASEAAPLPWDQAYEKAEAMLGRMQDDEKFTLMKGIGWGKEDRELEKWWYVGNTAPVSRLGIPSLNMQDAAGGFRTYWNEIVGTVTCWPSLLSLAATWDADLTKEWASALGREFADKGANAILGPSVNVHRAARNGRNFEYLSGEDPYLGSQLATAYVEGVHSAGIFAVMKHWVFNSQETNRNSESSNVDDKTSWEIYYPPFEAAVRAGVDATMCSYNDVDGIHSCSNEKHLKQVLKKDMGFKGFIQSDWWATHDVSLSQGLDQQMPGTDEFFNPENLRKQNQTLVNEAVTRILAVMYRHDLFNKTKCAPPNCESYFRKNVTSEAHAALAKKVATESVVLLKNEAGVLPLSNESVKKIAVIGPASVAGSYNPGGAGQGGGGTWWTGDYYSGGGSGHVAAGYVVTPLEGISRRAAEEGIQVSSSPSSDAAAAIDAAMGADISIVVAATTIGESQDRPDLALDDGIDRIIEHVARVSKKTIVLVQAPGAFLTPWRDSADAVLAMFLGGQETGSAWGSVLFGDHAPTGRLPLMLPATEQDTVAIGLGDEVDYSEGMATSYRNKNFKAAFSFGHGLTYTTFRMSRTPSSDACTDANGQAAVCVTVRVENRGKVAGQTTAQLYLEFPPEAGHPAPFLKGFIKTELLKPGDSQDVVFSLTSRDMSYYSISERAWIQVSNAWAHIGFSSSDIRQSIDVSTTAPTMVIV